MSGDLAMKENLLILNKVLDMAQELIYQDESPFAAGLLVEGSLFFAGNRCRSERNPNLHAEIVCINAFCKQHDYHFLENAIIFSSCEPCLMCLHTIYNSGIRHIIYAASIDDAIKYGSGDNCIHIIKYVKKMNMNITIEGPFLRERASEIFKECITHRGEL